MTDANEYILGTDRQELERLRFQHQVWTAQAYALWTRAGIATGQSVLDLGCGPGFTTLALADLVGPAGRVVARDMSARFLEHLGAECRRLGRTQVSTSLGPVEEFEPEAGGFDAAYARWLFCWLADAEPVLRRVARGIRPGGAIVLQEYLDWGAMKIVPRSAAFDRAVEACLLSWKAGGATIDIVERLPALAPACGLAVEHFQPVARVGGVGSLEWEWLGQFFSTYLAKVIEAGLLTPAEYEAWRTDWDARAAEGRSWVCTPTMADLVLRKR